MEAAGTAAVAEAGAGAGARPMTPEEEALRRNTDCVYFLASPLTCKKGNECDFRHSEGARMNPRDCWYWLNGNCLNPKCSFRHPPLDATFSATTPGIPAVSSQYAAYNTGKQMVPCYYFQKGNCLKGDKCPFYHGLQSAGNNPAEQGAKVSSFPPEQLHTQKNDLLGNKGSAQTDTFIQQGAPTFDIRSRMNSAKAAAAAIPAELVSNAVKSLPKSEKGQNGIQVVNKSFRSSSGEHHPECYQAHPECYQNHLPVENDSIKGWNENDETPPEDDLPEDSRDDADELLGESSPGFDVLVDNDADAAAYLHDEEDFGRDIYPVEDYEYTPADFDILPHHERERFSGMGEQDQTGRTFDGYERKRRRTSSERNMDRPFHSDRRFLQREIHPVEIDGSDLRHRLRRKKTNGCSSGVSPERNGEWHRRDEHYRDGAHSGHHTQRDRHQGPRGSTLSYRLQGRIKLPGRSPDRVDTRSEKERDRRRLRDTLSPGRPTDIQVGGHPEAGQHQERTRRRSSELASSARNADRLHLRRDAIDPVNSVSRRNFGPEPRKVNGSAESEASLDFEGPKPLSIILQRKREMAWGNGSSAHNVKEDKSAELLNRQTDSLVEAEKEGSDNIMSSEECKNRSGEEEYKEEDQIPIDGNGQSSSHGDKLEVEDIIHVGNQEADNYDQREGESDYEAIEGNDYKSGDENAYQDDEEFEDEDEDDDFARKVGVIFS